ncbi:MAG: glycosyltransferase family 4 protein [Actinomycetota bacterium]
MSHQGRDVVVVGHAADRTGPPLALLRALRALRESTDLDIELLLFRGGPLEEAFAALVPTTVIGEPVQPHDDRLRTRARSAATNLRLARAVPAMRRARLIYLNTSWTVRALALLGPGAPPIVAHVHELDLDIGDLLPSRDLRRLRQRPEHYIVGTPVAADNLVHRHGVAPDRIHLQPYFVEPTEPDAVRRPDTVPDDALLIGACGVTIWRKAPDLFVQLASRILESTDRDMHFAWIGGTPGGPRELEVPADIEALGLSDRVHFVGAQPDPWSWLAGLDVLVLPSREDTFPLVCLEAGSLAVPIVTFDQGGIPDLVRRADGGAVVPHLSVEAMADAVLGLTEDEPGRRAAGIRLAEHVRAEHGHDAGEDLARTIASLVP